MEITDVIQEVINEITQAQPNEDYLNTFALLDNNYDKVKYVEHYILELKKIEEITEKYHLRYPKDNKTSIDLHNAGNAKYAEKQYFDALELYNESICFAEAGSWNLTMNYANRSMVYFEIKRFRECLENIELARKTSKLAPVLAKRLQTREASARTNFKNFGELQPYPFRFSYERHRSIPFTVNTIFYGQNDQWGRHVRSTIYMPPGKLIAIEDPFVSVLHKESRYTRCAHCLKENFLSLIPCPNCTCTMFCSDDCLRQGTTLFHRFECPVIDLFQKIFYKTHMVALRMVFRGISVTGSIDNLMRFCRVPGNLNNCIFTVNFEHNYSHALYKSVHGLVTHQDDRSVHSFFYYATLASLMRRLLFDNTDFDMICYNEDKKTFFSDLLFHYLQISNCNATDLHVSELRNNYREGDTYGTALYPFRSMINHSCTPNVMAVYKGRTLHLYTLRPISMQTQLFISYDMHFSKKERIYRKSYLLAKYYFECTCEACLHDYPLLFDLKRQFYVRSIL